jgi:hypothetical protein
LKALGREIVDTYYRDAVRPDVPSHRHSDQLEALIRRSVGHLLKDSVFLLGAELDENVRFLSSIELSNVFLVLSVY